MPAGDIEVVRIDRLWHDRTQDTSHDFGSYRLQTTAIAVGRALARWFSVELIIKNRRGAIRARDTSGGNDPHDIPG